MQETRGCATCVATTAMDASMRAQPHATCSRWPRLRERKAWQVRSSVPGRDPQPVHLPRWKDGSHGADWLAQMVQMHLDEAWTPLDVHRKIGVEVARIYREERESGVDELGSLVLAMSTRMVGFDFEDAYVDSFDVANKASEYLMWKMGREVCCTSEQDLEDFRRYDASVQARRDGTQPNV